MSKNILMPLPSYDFDPTETAVPWQSLREAVIAVTFISPNGRPGRCDERMLTGNGLGLLAPLLAANKYGRDAYLAMAISHEFKNPTPWNEVAEKDFDGIILPGGHAKGMIEYLESKLLRAVVSDFFNADKPVGAICHGVLLAARTLSPKTVKSVIWNRKTTALLESQEFLAWNLTRLWLGDYYRTYPQSVEAEVTACLAAKAHFLRGSAPLLRDSPCHLERGFATVDGNYISARWPGDAHNFSQAFLKLLL